MDEDREPVNTWAVVDLREIFALCERNVPAPVAKQKNAGHLHLVVDNTQETDQ